ncbi:hypothetical protein B5S33_g3073 [[Candida] boidinii]|nr:hypothetical protein B5S30_g866 [[Candida] boidinii]OWB84427.1 hypothetical protein B5S33_g3073 [[Candida] boidinii]GMG07092.1 unnamed protein product [[Candida] boidinii]
MFNEVSIQDDDREALKNSPPLYNLDYINTEFKNLMNLNNLIDINNSQYLKFNYEKFKVFLHFQIDNYFNKDNEFFQELWRINGEVPEKANTFYQHFPKVATNFETEHHFENFININHFYLGRWLPRQIKNLLFPLEDYVYDQNMSEHARKLTAKSVPTVNECRLCERFKGISVFKRNGEWNCVRSEAVEGNQNQNHNNNLSTTTPTIPTDSNGKLNLSDEDELGLKFFQSYEEYRKWKMEFNMKIGTLKKIAFSSKDEKEFHSINEKIENYQNLRKNQNLPCSFIMTVKG